MRHLIDSGAMWQDVLKRLHCEQRVGWGNDLPELEAGDTVFVHEADARMPLISRRWPHLAKAVEDGIPVVIFHSHRHPEDVEEGEWSLDLREIPKDADVAAIDQVIRRK